MTENIDDRVEKAINKKLIEHNKKLKDDLDDFKKDFRSQLGKEISGLLSGAFSGSAGEALGAGAESILGGLIAGGRIDSRSVANSMAKTLVPEVKDFFNMSASQKGEGLSDLLNLSGRNS